MTMKKKSHIRIKPYTLHILGIRAMSADVFDLPPENNAVIVCCKRDNAFISEELDPNKVLWINFPDVEDRHYPDAFNRIHARIIIQFIYGLPDSVTDIYICCAKGGSCSPAVAAALLRASGRSDRDVWEKPFYNPNTLVYLRLCREFGLKTNGLSTYCRKWINERAYKKAQKEKGSVKYERWQILK